jgi:hypothetical protein
VVESIPRKVAELPARIAVVTVSEIDVADDIVPAGPVTLSEYSPGATSAATLMRTDDEAVAGFVLNVPAIPEGQLDAVKVTAELKPFTGAIVT